MKAEEYNAFLNILKEELVPAMGCTEPIAVAYAGALAGKILGAVPEKSVLYVSGNIIKNVKSVIVPHTGGRKGLKNALAVGMLYGDADKKLEVISDIDRDISTELDEYVQATDISVQKAESDYPFDIGVRVFFGDDTAYVRIVERHTNVVLAEKNGKIIFEKNSDENAEKVHEDRSYLSIKKITEFANEVNIDDVREILDRQIEFNTEIAKEGLSGKYGAEIGKILLSSYGNSIHNRAKAWAAAGSDARMNGCEKPVVINSGSGNQGITASVPVIVYARE